MNLFYTLSFRRMPHTVCIKLLRRVTVEPCWNSQSDQQNLIIKYSTMWILKMAIICWIDRRLSLSSKREYATFSRPIFKCSSNVSIYLEKLWYQAPISTKILKLSFILTGFRILPDEYQWDRVDQLIDQAFFGFRSV